MFASAGFAQEGFAAFFWATLLGTPGAGDPDSPTEPGQPELPEIPGSPSSLPRLSADDYTQMLLQLLPHGPAWAREAGTSSERILSAAGQELAALHLRIVQLLEEADPRTSSELLPDWERVVGLPDPCLDEPTSTEERRRRVVQRLTSQGGQSAAFFIGMLEALGFPGATVTEFRPMRCNSACNASINQGGWRYGWRVNLPVETVTKVMNCTSRCDAPLASWGDPGLLCLVASHKPAHTRPFVAYGT